MSHLSIHLPVQCNSSMEAEDYNVLFFQQREHIHLPWLFSTLSSTLCCKFLTLGTFCSICGPMAP